MSDPIEIRPGFVPPTHIRHAVFDWDGTLSFIRAGWGEVMLQVFLDHLPRLPDESDEARRRLAHDDIWRLNGKPTIHQMQCLADRVVDRGGKAQAAAEYQQEYAHRLDARVHSRLEAIRSGDLPAEAMQPPGALALLESLRSSGIQLHVVSGTEVRYVLTEVLALSLAPFFNGSVHGPSAPDDRTYSKRGVMDAILEAHSLGGDSLVVFGDGHVEIEQAKALGGVAIAVATDESDFGSGHIDPAKRSRLNDVGADLVIPDYSDLPSILGCLGLG
jgi:phosphoglycolate phosphatase